VVDADERLVGLVTERELIHAMLEKRGHDPEERARDAAAAVVA
jgi:CBS domain-containing protein